MAALAQAPAGVPGGSIDPNVASYLGNLNPKHFNTINDTFSQAGVPVPWHQLAGGTKSDQSGVPGVSGDPTFRGNMGTGGSQSQNAPAVANAVPGGDRQAQGQTQPIDASGWNDKPADFPMTPFQRQANRDFYQQHPDLHYNVNGQAMTPGQAAGVWSPASQQQGVPQPQPAPRNQAFASAMPAPGQQYDATGTRVGNPNEMRYPAGYNVQSPPGSAVQSAADTQLLQGWNNKFGPLAPWGQPAPRPPMSNQQLSDAANAVPGYRDTRLQGLINDQGVRANIDAQNTQREAQAGVNQRTGASFSTLSTLPQMNIPQPSGIPGWQGAGWQNAPGADRPGMTADANQSAAMKSSGLAGNYTYVPGAGYVPNNSPRLASPGAIGNPASASLWAGRPAEAQAAGRSLFNKAEQSYGDQNFYRQQALRKGIGARSFDPTTGAPIGQTWTANPVNDWQVRQQMRHGMYAGVPSPAPSVPAAPQPQSIGQMAWDVGNYLMSPFQEMMSPAPEAPGMVASSQPKRKSGVASVARDPNAPPDVLPSVPAVPRMAGGGGFMVPGQPQLLGTKPIDGGQFKPQAVVGDGQSPESVSVTPVTGVPGVAPPSTNNPDLDFYNQANVATSQHYAAVAQDHAQRAQQAQQMSAFGQMAPAERMHWMTMQQADQRERDRMAMEQQHFTLGETNANNRFNIQQRSMDAANARAAQHDQTLLDIQTGKIKPPQDPWEEFTKYRTFGELAWQRTHQGANLNDPATVTAMETDLTKQGLGYVNAPKAPWANTGGATTAPATVNPLVPLGQTSPTSDPLPPSSATTSPSVPGMSTLMPPSPQKIPTGISPAAAASISARNDLAAQSFKNSLSTVQDKLRDIASDPNIKPHWYTPIGDNRDYRKSMLVGELTKYYPGALPEQLDAEAERLLNEHAANRAANLAPGVPRQGTNYNLGYGYGGY